jgi:hypothetical protein
MWSRKQTQSLMTLKYIQTKQAYLYKYNITLVSKYQGRAVVRTVSRRSLTQNAEVLF